MGVFIDAEDVHYSFGQNTRKKSNSTRTTIKYSLKNIIQEIIANNFVSNPSKVDYTTKFYSKVTRKI